MCFGVPVRRCTEPEAPSPSRSLSEGLVWLGLKAIPPKIWTNGKNQPRPENRARPPVALSRMPDRLGPIDRLIGDERTGPSLRMAGCEKFVIEINSLS